MTDNIFTGTMPALMTPCTAERKPDFDALVRKGRELIDAGMSAVVYCGSMGDWPLLTEAERQEGVARLVAAGIPTIVGTGAVNTREAVSHAAHAAKVGAAYVSPFVGRLDDIGTDGMGLIADIVQIYRSYDYFSTEVLVASVRHPIHVVESAKMGADVVTLPPAVLRQMFNHPLTEKGLAAFLADWAKTGQSILKA